MGQEKQAAAKGQESLMLCAAVLCTFRDIVFRVMRSGSCVPCPVMLPRELYRRFFSSAEPASTALRLKALPDLKL